MDALTEGYITNRLSEAYEGGRNRSCYDYFSTSQPRPAAVLIPLFYAHPEDESKHAWQVLLTRRTEGVAEHQGQVAFPGGRADPTDLTPESTALREAYEEIGLEPTSVRILGKMKELPTISNYCVTPVVGVIPWPFELKLEVTEVSRVFSIPLDWLMDPAHHEVRQRTIPEPFSNILKEKTHPVIFFERYQDELLWGVSAQITLNFIDILTNKKLADA